MPIRGIRGKSLRIRGVEVEDLVYLHLRGDIFEIYAPAVYIQTLCVIVSAQIN